MAGKFELSKTSGGQFRFNLKAGNGQVILASEAYNSKDAVENGIDSVRKNAGDDARYDREVAKDGSFFFRLKAGNGQVIGMSEMYTSEAARDNGIESVQKNAPDATVDDQTD